MRSQPPSVFSMHETPIDSAKKDKSTFSAASATAISSSESPNFENRQKVSPTSKWKQRNEVSEQNNVF